MEEAARRIHKLGRANVLVKVATSGRRGDLRSTAASSRRFRPRASSPTTPTAPPHLPVATPRSPAAVGEAVRDAKAYVTRAIREGFALGRGVGALRHFLTEW
jgi:hydroxymethylpyrimidine/phosphomethylpyrimidine kinase